MRGVNGIALAGIGFLLSMALFFRGGTVSMIVAARPGALAES
jgi:hypothetical protein